jgi:hypothetical protein
VKAFPRKSMLCRHSSTLSRMVLAGVLIFLLVLGVQNAGDISIPSAFAQDEENNSGSQFPPFRGSTLNGSYIVEIDWQPESIGIDEPAIFLVKFLDGSGGPLPSPTIVNYDFTVAGRDLSLIGEFYEQETEDDGIGRPIIVDFETEGPIEITVWINSVGPSSSGERETVDESVTFNVTVVPEFQVSVIFLISAVTMSLIVLLNSRYGRGLKGQSI